MAVNCTAGFGLLFNRWTKRPNPAPFGRKFLRFTIVGLTAVALAVAGLLYSGQGRRIQEIAVEYAGGYVDLESIERWFDSVRTAVVGEEEKELIFAEGQIEEAMREVLRQQNESSTDAAEQGDTPPRYRY